MNSTKLQNTKSTQNNQVFYTSNEQSKIEIMKMILFTILSSRIKYVVINLTKDKQNYKRLLK